MASNWTVCGVCDYRHITKPSNVWCSECDEGLCEECKIHHDISKGTRSHGTVSISEYQELPNNVLRLARSCNKHNAKYQLFCKTHDCPCCKKCVVESHMECTELTNIDDITLNIISSNAFLDIEQTLSENAENIKRLRINREDNLASIGKKSREIENEVLETRARINRHLDNLQDTILKELKTREKKESNKIRPVLKSLIDKDKAITEHQTNIVKLKKYASQLQPFLALKYIEKDVIAGEQYMQSIVKSHGANEIDFSLKIKPYLQGMISSIQKFGDVVVTASPCNIPMQRRKDKQAQMMVAVVHVPITIDNLAPKLLQTLRTELEFSSGCTFLPDCRMVISCSVRKMIRVFKPDGSLDFDIEDFGRVFDVTYIGDNTVAVTSGYEYSARQINLIDLKRKKVTKTLNVNSVNTGVAYIEDKLIYCAGKDGIQMINLNDKSIVNVTKTHLDLFSYVVTFRDSIFYISCDNMSITCIDFRGNTRWVFENESVLINILGISVDGGGNVYVVGERTNNVVVISPDGNHYRQILTRDNGLESPAVIYIDISCNRLLVANTKEKAFVYDLK
ncbi:unnamed protein product [Mytilus edulis]|uniref:B box-type domain-containing protein n=1 Tax=Mytilus edulis TaxID=6550 RepID=A0A8S3R0T7_MYTED|nr:unnamed protein product [Mytilus edulis]